MDNKFFKHKDMIIRASYLIKCDRIGEKDYILMFSLGNIILPYNELLINAIVYFLKDNIKDKFYILDLETIDQQQKYGW